MNIFPFIKKYNTRSLFVVGGRHIKDGKARQHIVFFLVACVLGGCASVHHSKKLIPPDQNLNSIHGPIKPLLKAPRIDGIIFGKADFRGVLKVEYVKLNIIDEENPQKQYELLFGDRDENNAPTWDARPVEPHYFFLELPVGKYRITTISIPVGTTLATESTDISFTVEKETVIYLGTLRVTGTDQKIRFGGVPLLRPGFEYKVEILNEKEDAIDKFKTRYPLLQRDIQVKLMRAMRIETF